MFLKHSLLHTYTNVINAKEYDNSRQSEELEVDLYYTDKFDPHVLNNMLNISILASSESSEIFTNRMPSAHDSVIIKQRENYHYLIWG